MKADSLGDRIKSKYEDVFRQTVPQRTYAILRIDGKAFHTYTKGLPRPFCKQLAGALDQAAMSLVSQLPGCKLAYGQSDEYSFLFTDFDSETTDMWFNGNIQKIVSVASSIFTAEFNRAWQEVTSWTELSKFSTKLATFDARLFVIPNRTDVFNYFVWRQQDASRNSLSMLAAAHFSPKALHGKKAADMHQMLNGVGVNWHTQQPDFRHGRCIIRVPRELKEVVIPAHVTKPSKRKKNKPRTTTRWVMDRNIPFFTDKTYLGSHVPESL